MKQHFSVRIFVRYGIIFNHNFVEKSTQFLFTLFKAFHSSTKIKYLNTNQQFCNLFRKIYCSSRDKSAFIPSALGRIYDTTHKIGFIIKGYKKFLHITLLYVCTYMINQTKKKLCNAQYI